MNEKTQLSHYHEQICLQKTNCHSVTKQIVTLSRCHMSGSSSMSHVTCHTVELGVQYSTCQPPEQHVFKCRPHGNYAS